MGTINEKRKLITDEMEAGRGSDRLHSSPVSLEPSLNPFNLRTKPPTLFERFFGRQDEDAWPSIAGTVEIGELRSIRIRPSKEDDNTLEVAERLVVSLLFTEPVSFEIVAHTGMIGFQIVAARHHAEQVASQLRAHFPNADVYPDNDILVQELPEGHAVARAYRLKSSHFFQLSPASEKAFEPFRTFFGNIGGIADGRFGALQLLFAPVVNDWQSNMRRASRNPYDPGQSPFVDLPQLPKVVDKKIAKPLFAVSIRLVASDESLLRIMEGFFKHFENTENGIIPVNGNYPIKSIIERNSHVHGSILNSTELSDFLHLPASELIESMPAIERAIRSFPVPGEFTGNGPVLGYNLHCGTKKAVHHSTALPNRHVYVTGKSGYGKSNLILYSAIQRIERGDGVGVIDPHGSLIREGILPRIPKERIADVVYLNAGDFEHPMAINPLAHGGTKLEKEHIRVDLLNFFEDLFEAPLGVNVQHSLNFFIITLLTRRDSTLSDIERLLLNKDWRNTLVQDIDDDRIRMFWEHEFPQLEKRGIVTAITNKLSPLILPDSAIAPMLTQRENRLDFLKVMDGRKIFLCNLSHGDIGKRNSQLLGKLLVSKLQIAAMMREGNGTSPDFYLYIDEFQHMVCPSMADILSGARKYGLHLWLTNQMIGDIPDYILRHVFNASTLIFFATDSPTDQTLIEKNLSKRFKAEDIGQLKRGETYVKMVGSAFNMMTERMPDPPQVRWVDEIIAASRARHTTSKTALPVVPLNDKTANSHRPKDTKTGRVLILSPQERSFLEYTFHNPTLSVTGLYKQQGLSAYMGDKLKSALKDKGFLYEVATHLGGKARIAKFLLLTPPGLSALGTEFDPRSGKGGVIHRYWQSVIRFHAENRSYRVTIEEPIPGSKETVDVGLERDGTRLAFEISITTEVEFEINNAKKCLKAGYAQIVILFLEEDKMIEFQDLSRKVLTNEERLKVSAGLIYCFCRFL